jgi:ferredoxin
VPAGAQKSGDDREVRMRVEADWDACESNAVCAGLVPSVFEVDDEDNLQILEGEIPAQLEQQVRHAVSSCPKMALRIVE